MPKSPVDDGTGWAHSMRRDRESETWFRMGTYPDIGLRGDNCHERFDELLAMARHDPTGWDKIIRHCYRTGRGNVWGAS